MSYSRPPTWAPGAQSGGLGERMAEGCHGGMSLTPAVCPGLGVKEGQLAESGVLPKNPIRTGQNGEYQWGKNGVPAASATTETPVSNCPGVSDPGPAGNVFPQRLVCGHPP